MPAFNQSAKQFFRNLGTGPAQKRFYLGHDPIAARNRETRLDALWAIIRADKPALWTDATLTIAKAIAKGDEVAVLPEPPEDLRHGDGPLTYWRTFSARFGGIIRIQPHDAPRLAAQLRDTRQRITDRVAAIDEELTGYAHDMIREGRQGKELLASVQGGAAVADLLARLADSLRHDADHNGDQSGWVAAQLRQIDTLRRMFGSVVIRAVEDLKAVAGKLSNPTTAGATGKPLARETRKQLWQRFRQALDLGDEHGAALPRGWAKVKVKLAKPTAVDTLAQFTPEELAALYRNASPIVRAMILLGLNCGFQEADFGDLEDGHLYLDRPLPGVLAHRAGAKPGDCWLMMTRGKTGVPGLARLWPETVAAVRYLIARRDRITRQTGKPTAKLFIADTGKPLTDPTATGGRGRRVQNLWRNCLATTAKELPTLQKLPVKYLRKASGDYMREFTEDSTVAVALRHGHASSDTLMEQYTRRPWKRVAEATDELRRRLAVVFGADVA